MTTTAQPRFECDRHGRHGESARRHPHGLSIVLACLLLAIAAMGFPARLAGQQPAEPAQWEAEAQALRQQRATGAAAAENRSRAIELYRKAAQVWQEQGLRQRAGNALAAVGQLLDAGGKPGDALQAFEQALELLGTDAEPKPRASALYGKAKMLAAAGRFPPAIAAFREVLPLCEQTSDRFQQALTLHNLANAYWNLADTRNALANYQRALEIRTEIGDKPGLAYSWYGLTITHWSAGERQLALDAARRSEEIWIDLKSPFGQGNARNSMGLLYAELGDFPRAREAYRKAMAMWRQAGSEIMQAYTHNNLGMLAAQQGRLAEARKEYALALPVLEKAQDTLGLAYLYQNQADLAVKARRWSEAQPLYARSLEIKRRMGNRFGEAITEERIGSALVAAGQAVEAIPHLRNGLALHEVIGNRSGIMMARASLARAHQALGKTPESLAHFREALALAEEDRGSIANEDLRVTYFTTVQDLFDEYIALLARESERSGTAALAEQALLAHERSRSRQLLDSLLALDAARESPAFAEGAATGAATDWIRREREQRGRLRAVAQRLQRLNSAQAAEDEKTAARAQLDRVLREWYDLRGQAHQDGLLAHATLETISSLPDLQLGDDTALLVFRVGAAQSYGWRLDQGGLTLKQLPDPQSLRRQALRFRDALTAREPRPEEFGVPEERSLEARAARIAAADAVLEQEGRRLSWMLLSGVLRGVKARRLVLSLDGVLSGIPIAALPHPYNPDRLLVDDFELVHAPSATVLAQLQQRPRSPHRAASVVVVADPVFTAQDSRVKARSRSAIGQPHSDTPALPRLRFTEAEAKAIASLRPDAVQVYRGFQATQDLLRQDAVARAGVIHLATHAWVDEDRPAASAIAFSGLRPDGTPIDGQLREFEIYNLKLAARLVVLSGCRTARGKTIAGEGVQSLARGFFAAGVPQVLATQWAVQDSATAELMERFYHAYLGNQQTASAALRQAQLAARRTPHLRHPYYWAAFTLQGDWR
jgi:tetratricopeptide (TPR) repeat protein